MPVYGFSPCKLCQFPGSHLERRIKAKLEIFLPQQPHNQPCRNQPCQQLCQQQRLQLKEVVLQPMWTGARSAGTTAQTQKKPSPRRKPPSFLPSFKLRTWNRHFQSVRRSKEIFSASFGFLVIVLSLSSHWCIRVTGIIKEFSNINKGDLSHFQQ